MALTKFNFNSFDVTSAASKGLGFNASANGFSTINPGSMTLIKTLTASSSATLSFVHGSSNVVLDSTYPVYLFKYINCHPSAASTISFNGSIDTGSNYNVTKTSNSFYALNKEDDSSTALSYNIYQDHAQGTGAQGLVGTLATDNDSSGSGELYIFNPSSTTFVKQYIAIANGSNAQSVNSYTTGYFNTTSAIDAIQFLMSTGNIDSGTIKLYGISDS